MTDTSRETETATSANDAPLGENDSTLEHVDGGFRLDLFHAVEQPLRTAPDAVESRRAI